MKIFISAVVGEFEEGREKLKKLIEEEFQYQVYVSEAERLPDFKSSEEKIQKEIEVSNIFILIIGSQYGSPHPNGKQSITEWEYIAALNLRKPVLVFRNKVDRYERKQEPFVKKVMDFKKGKYTPKPFRDISELKEQVKDTITKQISEAAEISLPVIYGADKRGNLFMKADIGTTSGTTIENDGVVVQVSVHLSNTDLQYTHRIHAVKLIYEGQEIITESAKEDYHGTPKSIKHDPVTVKPGDKKTIFIKVKFHHKTKEENSKCIKDIINLKKNVTRPFQVKLITG